MNIFLNKLINVGIYPKNNSFLSSVILSFEVDKVDELVEAKVN